ncbi:MAG TPA: hypothetical protein PKI03_34050, partial [Pseudomonadota bacterium]|nr:hypothetical protein [Pseudomonadota bacterium]
MSNQSPVKQSPRKPPPPPPTASRVRRENMDDLLDDFIARANQRLQSEKSRSWDLMPVQVIEEMDVVAVEQPPAVVVRDVAVHSTPAAVVAPFVAP